MTRRRHQCGPMHFSTRSATTGARCLEPTTGHRRCAAIAAPLNSRRTRLPAAFPTIGESTASRRNARRSAAKISSASDLRVDGGDGGQGRNRTTDTRIFRPSRRESTMSARSKRILRSLKTPRPTILRTIRSDRSEATRVGQSPKLWHCGCFAFPACDGSVCSLLRTSNSPW